MPSGPTAPHSPAKRCCSRAVISLPSPFCVGPVSAPGGGIEPAGEELIRRALWSSKKRLPLLPLFGPCTTPSRYEMQLFATGCKRSTAR